MTVFVLCLFLNHVEHFLKEPQYQMDDLDPNLVVMLAAIRTAPWSAKAVRWLFFSFVSRWSVSFVKNNNRSAASAVLLITIPYPGRIFRLSAIFKIAQSIYPVNRKPVIIKDYSWSAAACAASSFSAQKKPPAALPRKPFSYLLFCYCWRFFTIRTTAKTTRRIPIATSRL